MMNTPFEDLEYLADYLPEEGETVVVTRRDGELVCHQVASETAQAGVADAELYGRLILANERLTDLALVPMWVCLLAAFGIDIAFFQLSGVGWHGWYVAVGIAAVAGLTCTTWIAVRRRNHYRKQIRPMLERQMRKRGLNQFALVAAVRQHPELACLLTEVSRGAQES